jgi:hypothetical protein
VACEVKDPPLAARPGVLVRGSIVWHIITVLLSRYIPLSVLPVNVHGLDSATCSESGSYETANSVDRDCWPRTC